MIKYHPILFSTPMVQAILEGRKTQIRRIVKDKMLQKATEEDDLEFLLLTVSQKYKEGDILWVRETHGKPEGMNSGYGAKYVTYKADSSTRFIYDNGQSYKLNDGDLPVKKWKPSIFMPKDTCRIFLKIKKIRLERVRDIFHYEAREEGVGFVEGINGNIYYNYLTKEYGCNELFSFMTLWQSINGNDSWDKNPFVWVYKFERIEKPLDFIV